MKAEIFEIPIKSVLEWKIDADTLVMSHYELHMQFWKDCNFVYYPGGRLELTNWKSKIAFICCISYKNIIRLHKYIKRYMTYSRISPGYSHLKIFLQELLKFTMSLNLPSPRSKWQKNEWEKRKIIATGGLVRADLFYWDCL